MAAFAFAAATSLALAAASAGPRAGGRAGGIVSLNLCTDELVLLVADPARVRSVSYLSHSADETPLWKTARRYRPNDGTMLGAAAMRPALIVTMGSGGRDRTRLAATIGARLIELPYPQTLDDIARSVRMIGRATGGDARAERVVAAMRAAAATVPARSVDAMRIDGAGRTSSADGLGAAWLRLAGLRQRGVPGDRASLELMMTRPPAVLVRSNYRARQMSSATAWMRHPVAARVRSGRTLDTDGRRWTCAGPTLLPEILRLRRAVKG